MTNADGRSTLRPAEPTWVPLAAVHLIHDRQIEAHGGLAGVRDPGVLAMGCDRPRNVHAYRDPTVLEVAASLAFGIAKAHAFVDGNKRTAFVATATFLRLNGLHLKPDPAEGAQAMDDLASGVLSELGFAAWLGRWARPLVD